MSNGASRIFNIMRKSGTDTVSEVICLKVKSLNPLLFTIDNRLSITSDFCIFDDLIDLTKLNKDDTLLATTYNNGQKFFIHQAISSKNNIKDILDVTQDISAINKNLLDLNKAVENKVDKVEGQGLSDENFTLELKQKLENIDLVELSDTISKLIDTKILEDNKKKYYIGKIIMDTENINPSTYLGFGTWQYWGQGKVPVGVDPNQVEFNTVEKTGGEKTHTLTINELPSHNHSDFVANGQGSGEWGYNFTYDNNTAGQNSGASGYTGGSQPHNNLQPYITCYMWKRIS